METINIYKNTIKQINMEVVGACNLRCTMCPHSIGSGREQEFNTVMPIDLCFKIIDEAIPLGLKYVTFGGGGEATLHKKLEDIVRYLSDRNIKTLMYTNGQKLTPEYFVRLCESGMGTVKVSCHGYDRESYHKWMSTDTYHSVRGYLRECFSILSENEYETTLETNHIIHEYDQLEYQKKRYLQNWVEYLGNNKAEIWLKYNWAGTYSNEGVPRHKLFSGKEIRTCGRPMGSIMEVRSGGLNGKKGAVVPCPYVLGQDSKAVMGHLEDESILDAFNSPEMLRLRKAHIEKKFDEFDYCKNCDHLIELPEALVWTNHENRNYGSSRISNIKYGD